eukprot:gene5174-3721_t
MGTISHSIRKDIFFPCVVALFLSLTNYLHNSQNILRLQMPAGVLIHFIVLFFFAFGMPDKKKKIIQNFPHTFSFSMGGTSLVGSMRPLPSGSDASGQDSSEDSEGWPSASDEEKSTLTTFQQSAPLERLHPWMVAEGFEIAWSHCLTYCPHAIPGRVIYVVHAIYKLACCGCLAPHDSSAGKEESRLSFPGWTKTIVSPQLFACDAIELLVRLCLRKGLAFVERKLEYQYGEQLKVGQALSILEVAHLQKEGLNLPFRGTKRCREVEDTTDSPQLWEPFMAAFTGNDVAQLLMSLSSGRRCSGNQKELERLVIHILGSLTSISLRRVVAEMYRNCGREHAGSTLRTVEVKPAGIPTRKSDMINYLLHRSFKTLLPKDTNTREVSDAVRLFSNVWDTHVGRVWVVNEEVHKGVELVARLFHVLTSNFCAAGIFRKDLYSLLLSIVAHSPTQLLHYYQRHILLAHFDVCHLSIKVEMERNLESTRDSWIRCIEEPDLSWIYRYSSASVKLFPSVHIFSSEEELHSYWKALKLHETLFKITDGASNYAQKLMGRDEAYVTTLFQNVMDLLSTLHNPLHVSERDHKRAREYFQSRRTDRDQRSAEPLSARLHRDGFSSYHLLQFTPQYRLYACLELLFPLMESLRLYEKAVECLEILLYRPLLVLHPLSLDSRVSSPASLKLLYRYEKRGTWVYRLGMNYSHLKQTEHALKILNNAHQKFEELQGLSEPERETLLEMGRDFIFSFTEEGEADRGSSAATKSATTFSSLTPIQRRARMLRGLWSPKNILNLETVQLQSQAEYHAAMEFILQRYCHRSDMLAIENLIRVLHRKAFRWTPLPKSSQLLTASIWHPSERTIQGIRDSNNSKGWKDPSQRFASASTVEGLVLHHYLANMNDKSDDKDVLDEELHIPVGNETLNWKGLHCEGRWIAYLSRVLLWECFYFYGETPLVGAFDTDDQKKKTMKTFSSSLWLSHFHDGPLDASTHVLFCHRRQRLLDMRLRFLDGLSDDEFIEVVARRCGEQRKVEVEVGGARSRKVDQDPFLEGEEDSVALARRSDDSCHERQKRDPFTTMQSIAPFPYVMLNGFPLLDMIPAIPRKSLLKLLRCMFLCCFFDGFSGSTSGFPDLVLWRSHGKQATTDGSFKLIEVKGPQDTLSSKQITVNDCLLRCGFDVTVVHVEEPKGLENVESLIIIIIIIIQTLTPNGVATASSTRKLDKQEATTTRTAKKKKIINISYLIFWYGVATVGTPTPLFTCAPKLNAPSISFLFSFPVAESTMSEDGSSFSVIPVNGLGEGPLLPPEQEKFSNDVYTFIKPHIDVGDRVVKVVSCRKYYSAVLLESGSLLLFCPDVPESHRTSVESDGELVVDVAAGESHIVFCTESGSVYTFGYCNRFGQLGDGSLWKVPDGAPCSPPPLSHPKRIPGFGEKYEDIELHNQDTDDDAGGGEAAPGGATDGVEDVEPIEPAHDSGFKKRFVRGDISYDIKMKGSYPQNDPVKICSVACGLHHTLLMSAKRNSVYACGRGHCGQLSGKRTVPVMASFRIIRLLFGLPIRSITAAGHHSFVLLSTGKLLAFGENSCGQLGVGHCRKVFAPTTASFLPENKLFAAAFKEGGAPAASKRLQDAKMYSSLRAAYSSYESTYYPMRVERIDAELAPHEPFIIEVWTCETITIVLTSELKWMSCGLPLSRFTGLNDNAAGRFDGFGVLGRPLMTKEDTYSFGYMNFSCAIREKIKESGYVFPGCSEDEDDVSFQLPAEKRLECLCYPHSTVVKIPGPSAARSGQDFDDDDDYAERSPATIFLQSNVASAFVQLRASDNGNLGDDMMPYHRVSGLRKPDNEAAVANFVLRGTREGVQDLSTLDNDSCTFEVSSAAFLHGGRERHAIEDICHTTYCTAYFNNFSKPVENVEVLGIEQEWLDCGGSRWLSVSSKHDTRGFGVIGGSPEFGMWGKTTALPLELVSPGSNKYICCCSNTSVEENIELRVVVLEYPSATKKASAALPVAVECGSTLPRLVPVSQMDEGHFKATMNLSSYPNIRFASIVSDFPAASLLPNQQGPLLTLNFYANNPRLPYDHHEWNASNSSIASTSASTAATTAFEVFRLKRIPTYGSRWGDILPLPCPSGKVCQQKTFSRAYSPTTLIQFQDIKAADDLWCIKELSKCLPVIDPGLHHHRTQDYWIATINTHQMENHVLEITVRVPVLGVAHEQQEFLYGKTILAASMLGQGTHGTIDVPVQCEQNGRKQVWVMLHIQYTLHYPVHHPKNNLRLLRSKQSYEGATTKKPVGHRGLGRTFTRRGTSSNKCIKFAENSIEAFNMAHRRGCEMVEFDVMLTDDGVPIVFHDPVVELLAKAAPTSIGEISSSENLVPTSIPVHYLTEKQLRWVLKQSKNLGGISSCRLKNMLIRYWSDILAVGRKRREPKQMVSCPSPISSLLSRRIDINHPVPTLKEIFLGTPLDLRLNIEVKYPFQPVWDDNLFMQKDVFEINRFVDGILNIVFEYADDGRYIAFSSFEPDVCVALATKQNRFDVFFLSDTTEQEDLKDYRTYYVEGAIQFAYNHKLSGISIQSTTLQENEDEDYGKLVVEAAHSRGLKVWTWGEANDDSEFVARQIHHLGVDGVITDNVTEHGNATLPSFYIYIYIFFKYLHDAPILARAILGCKFLFRCPSVQPRADKADDMLLLSNAIPEVAAKYLYGAKKESELCDPLVDALFPKFEVLQGIGAEVHSSGFCSERNRRTKCAMQLCDIGRAYQTTGTLRNYPKLSQYLTAVCEVLSCSTSYVFDYNRENAMDVARGTYGQPLAQQMIRNMRSHINQPTFKLYEYSAHDTTISPLAVTLGDSSGTMMEPPFASTFIVELLSRNQNYYVRLLFGHAGVTPSTNFQFGLTDFQMQCMKNGKSYIAENNVCPLEDFVEFIDFTKPTNPNGLCIVDPDLLEQMNCAPNVAPDQASELCLKYRHACPQEACGKDYISTSNKQCVPVVSSTPSSSGVSGWTIFFLMLLAFCAGAAALHFYPKALGWWHNRRSPEDEPLRTVIKKPKKIIHFWNTCIPECLSDYNLGFLVYLFIYYLFITIIFIFIFIFIFFFFFDNTILLGRLASQSSSRRGRAEERVDRRMEKRGIG